MPMKITEKDVEQAALLSRLELTAQDTTDCTKSLNTILEYMDKLNNLDASTVDPSAHVLRLKNVFREDKREPSLNKESVLGNAPEEQAGAFKVPRIV